MQKKHLKNSHIHGKNSANQEKKETLQPDKGH